MALAFAVRDRRGDPWNFVGLTSAFPDLGLDGKGVNERRPCGHTQAPGCKVFEVPRLGPAADAPAEPSEIDPAVPDKRAEEAPDQLTPRVLKSLKDQVLVFQYKGKFHAVDNRCPHQSFPLSRGTPFDIEDFGVVLSAGITCPQHDWSFDLHSGQGDRGSYRLAIWELELRPVATATEVYGSGASTPAADTGVWIRRKQKIG